MIRSVIFDIDDTLYDQMEPFAAACRTFSVLRDADLDALYQARAVRGMEALQQMDAGSMTLEENHIYRMQKACEDLGISLSAQEALQFQAVYAAAQKQIRPTPDMERVLSFCREAGYFLAVISNGPSEHQRKKIPAMQLQSFFPQERVLTSGDCGWLKPDVRIFQLAASKWNLQPSETLYVGDSFAHDILGAAHAGWQTFWLNRRGLPLPASGTHPSGSGLEQALLEFLQSDRKPRLF